MKFFHGCTSAKEAKEIYHKLAKCFHPDKGGNDELMKELTSQYETWDAPVIDQNPFQRMYTPNNMDMGSNPFRRMNSTFDFEVKIQARDLEISILKARIQDASNEILRLNMYKQKEAEDFEKRIIKLIEDLSKAMADNKRYADEIARLSNLKKPTNMIQRLKRIFT